MSFDIGN